MKSRVLAILITLLLAGSLSGVATSGASAMTVPKVHPLDWPNCC